MDTSTVMPVCTDALSRPRAPRRLRSVEEKLQIVAETMAPGASVAEVARRHGVNANLVFGWRRQQEQGVLGQRTRKGDVKLLPVQVTGEPTPPSDVSRPVKAASEGRIEIILAKDVRIAISGAVAVERIEQVLAMLRRSP